jgi:predicted nucleic acid-binding protein
MNARVFLDTNIFVYAFDNSEQEKKNKSLELIENKAQEGQLIISTQVLQEFYVVVSRKLDHPLTEDQAEEVLRKLGNLPIVQVDPDLIFSAVSLSKSSQISFWDALIVRAAIRGGCKTLYSEDLQHHQKFDTVQIVNPFK